MLSWNINEKSQIQKESENPKNNFSVIQFSIQNGLGSVHQFDWVIEKSKEGSYEHSYVEDHSKEKKDWAIKTASKMIITLINTYSNHRKIPFERFQQISWLRHSKNNPDIIAELLKLNLMKEAELFLFSDTLENPENLHRYLELLLASSPRFKSLILHWFKLIPASRSELKSAFLESLLDSSSNKALSTEDILKLEEQFFETYSSVSEKQRVLESASKQGDFEVVRRFVDRGVPLNISFSDRSNLLHRAVWTDNAKFINSLNKDQFSLLVHQLDSREYTPLHYAILLENTPLIRLLLEKLDPKIYLSLLTYGRNFLHYTVIHKKAQSLGVLLEIFKPEDWGIQTVNTQSTPLMIAVHEGQFKMAKMILNKMRPQDILLYDANGKNILFHLCKYSLFFNQETPAFIEEIFKKISPDSILTKNPLGESPLEHADFLNRDIANIFRNYLSKR